jgi:hypothetical protein
VYSQSARPLGVSIGYGDDEKLREIDIDSVQPYSENGGADWAKDALALNLRGDTDQLINHFSEDLCRELLGTETRKEHDGDPRLSYASTIYEKRGMVIRYEIDLRGKERSFFDVQLNLVRPIP